MAWINNYLEIVAYYWPELSFAFFQTIQLMGIAMALTLVFGLVVGFTLFLSQRQGKKLLYGILDTFVNIVRSFPFLLLVIVLIPFTRLILGSAFGTIPASVPVSIVGIGMFGRLVEQTLLDVPEDVLALANSYGATTWQLIRHFLLVEARSGIVLSYTSVIISLVSYSTVMGVVGGGGIGDFALRYGYQRYEYEIMYTTIVIMIIMVILMQLIGSSLARKLDKRKI